MIQFEYSLFLYTIARVLRHVYYRLKNTFCGSKIGIYQHYKTAHFIGTMSTSSS